MTEEQGSSGLELSSDDAEKPVEEPMNEDFDVNFLQSNENDQEPPNDEESKDTQESSDEEDEETPLIIRDHVSIRIPSSTLRLRSTKSVNTVTVYEDPAKQTLLEQQSSNEILVKNIPTPNRCGLYFLRSLYTFVALLLSGFVFLFCFQVILYLFLDLAVATGNTTYNESTHPINFVGVLLSLPLFIYGLATGALLSFGFAWQAWSGGEFIKQFAVSSVFTEWVYFGVFLGVPLLVMSFSLLVRTDSWWKITALTWFFCVFAFYVVFCFAVLWYEVRGTLLLMNYYDKVQQQKEDQDDANGDENNNRESILGQLDEGEYKARSFFSVLGKAILLRQRNLLSGMEKRMFLLKGSEDEEELKKSLITRMATHHSRRCWTRLTTWCSCLWDAVDPPTRLFSFQEVLGTRPVITKTSWTLDHIYCASRHQSIVLVKGPAALTPRQLSSSLACIIFGQALILILIIAFLVWFEMNALTIAIIVAVVALLMMPSVRQAFRTYKLYQRIRSSQDGDDDSVQQLWQSFRVTKAKDGFAWTVFAIFIVFFFIWPVVQLFINENYPLAAVFVVTAILSAIHFYLDPCVLLQEYGPLEDSKLLAKGDWRFKSRLSQILTQIDPHRGRKIWMIVLGIFVLVFLILCINSVTESGEDDGRIPTATVFLPDFVYEPAVDQRYPTCRLSQGLDLPTNIDSVKLIDYVFLSNIVYLDGTLTQPFLNKWFGAGNATDQDELVNGFQVQSNYTSPVYYRFITYNNDEIGVVAIRGSVNAWDWFVNAQLWSAAAIAQMVRGLLPAGDIWTPILNTLIRIVTFVGRESLSQAAHYKQTTEFVKYLQSSGNYSTVQVTGQSLGGGLSIITGAQTGAPAIALSGPNAKLSRDTFEPRLTLDQLNRFTFNVIPNRDIVPRVDDVANLAQNIECRAPKNHLFACHSALRSLCETMYNCGTDNRPAICQCKDLGYPEPIPKGNRTFEEACVM